MVMPDVEMFKITADWLPSYNCNCFLTFNKVKKQSDCYVCITLNERDRPFSKTIGHPSDAPTTTGMASHHITAHRRAVRIKELRCSLLLPALKQMIQALTQPVIESLS